MANGAACFRGGTAPFRFVSSIFLELHRREAIKLFRRGGASEQVVESVDVH